MRQFADKYLSFIIAAVINGSNYAVSNGKIWKYILAVNNCQN